jgi:hypothetical protein
MSSGAQVELDWAAIDAAQGGEGASGAGGARGTNAHAPAEPSTYRSDEEILGLEPVGQASACPPGDSAEHRLPFASAQGEKPAPQTPGTDSATTANTPAATNDTEDLLAFREMFPGGAAEALTLREAARDVESLRESAREVESLRQSAQELRQAAQAVDQIDAAIFSGDSRAQAQVVADLARANPGAFRQLFAEAARVLAGMGPAALEQQRDSSSSRPFYIQTSSQGKQAGTPRNDSAAGSHPPAPKDGFGGQARHSLGDGGEAGHEARAMSHESQGTGHGFDPAAYASFERGTNDAVARNVRAAIGDTLGRVLPDGIAEGAARRIGDDIFNEIHRTLAADRTLSEQVGDVLRAPLASGQGWRFGAAEQQRVASLLAGRARQLVPGVARRVVGEWTSSVLGTARSKAARQAAAAARVDIAAPGGSLDSRPLAWNARGETLRPMAARGVDYGSMSDDEILSM